METIIYEKKDNIRILTLNRPHRANALNQQMDEEMGEAVADFTNDSDARVLIVTGAGEKHFSAGMDLKEMGERQAAGLPSRDTTRKSTYQIGVSDIWKPIIAAINGDAVGGGLEICLGCDIRIAAENARLGFQEPRFGLVPGLGMYKLPRMINFGWALELLLTGDLIPACEALRIGIVNQVVPSSELMPAALKMAERIVVCAPLAIQVIKESAYRSHDMSLRDALAAKFGPSARDSEDFNEGVRAFAERRKPVWKGR
jgi:enoyl-CoA hydratase/carnithine racemase